VQRFFVELARQVHARFRGIEVLVQVQHQVVRHDRVAGGEERDQAMDQVLIGRRHLLVQVGDVDLEIDLLHRPGVLDGVAVHLVEVRVTHRTQGQLETGIEQHLTGFIGHGGFSFPFSLREKVARSAG